MLRKILANFIFILNILILFFLFVYDKLEFPNWMHVIGRMHPMILHLPIGMLIMVSLLVLLQHHFKKKSSRPILLLTLYIAAAAAALTAFMGIILSSEGGYDTVLLNRHLYTGVAISLLAWALVYIFQVDTKKKRWFNAALVCSVMILVLTGHMGASLTHGENYVLQPIQDKDETELVITDSTSIYEAAIQPIFKAKCFSCHNEKKAKGDLIMTSIESILKGGENGVIWVAGAPEKSELMKRVNLPEEHDDHMPPTGKPQLNESEIVLLHQWIRAGAEVKKAWTKFDTADSVRIVANPFIQKLQQAASAEVSYSFPFASAETIEKLNTPYRTVAPFALKSPALKVDFFLRETFSRAKLEELLPVKEQVVILNLSNMPVTDEDAKVLRQFTNLEKLNLQGTGISGQAIRELTELKKLKSLSVTGTSVDGKSVEPIAGISSLQEVFVWNTKLTPADVDRLQKKFPSIHWDAGFIPDSSEMLRLTQPILLNESNVLGDNDRASLKNNLPGTTIRYTLDGSAPDSISGTVYKEPIPISQYTILKAIACKEQWYCSEVAQFALFKKGFTPTQATLLNAPNKDYPGIGSQTVIDFKKGTADNFRDEAWLGYREKPFITLFHFDHAPDINSITISYARNISSYLMPPTSIEVWAGNDQNKLGLISKVNPPQPTGMESSRVDGFTLPIGKTNYSFYKVIAFPVVKLPDWHPGKGDKGWVFIDEVFFN
ncbi:MAG: chitobiase/beta-hexosaminidase C-terminal domain-containing protein [Cyclobacteriaceae bacterium]|nr:chitobiase/beta-hexosaminidase C-terminal domain-containing protein [Cyclobacteriaceae bacterium]